MGKYDELRLSIDDLIMSVHGHNHEVINEISQNKTLFENVIKAFSNINKYFKGRMFKINCVVTIMNHESLLAILQFVNDLGAKQINFTFISRFIGTRQ